MDYYIFSE